MFLNTFYSAHILMISRSEFHFNNIFTSDVPLYFENIAI